MNYVVLLAVSAGIAIALQVTVNSVGLGDLGIGGLIGVSGLATAAVGFLATLHRPHNGVRLHRGP